MSIQATTVLILTALLLKEANGQTVTCATVSGAGDCDLTLTTSGYAAGAITVASTTAPGTGLMVLTGNGSGTCGFSSNVRYSVVAATATTFTVDGSAAVTVGSDGVKTVAILSAESGESQTLGTFTCAGGFSAAPSAVISTLTMLFIGLLALSQL